MCHTARKPLNKKQMEIVRLICEGKTMKQAADICSVSLSSVSHLMARDDVRQKQLAYAESVLYNVAGKAAMVISEQLDSTNPWIQQQAARTILDYINTLKKGTQTAVVVNFGMPQPGMPEAEPVETDGDVQ